MTSRVLRFLGLYLAVSLVAAPILLLQLLPFHPRSALGWIILFVVALPAVVAIEFVGDFLLTNRVSAAVDRKTRGTSLSWARITYVLGVYILSFAVAIVGVWACTRLFL
jgi:hypothetical protein